ncbi:hypothetical protein U0041_03785 [Novosphingobium capsulatum]|nr:hypothetical protein U0041_03785 [Novosphingobium capsulatum]
MQRCLVGHQQATPEEICFRFHSTVVRALASFIQWRHVTVSQEEMREFVAKVTALAQRMVAIVVYDGGSNSAWDCQCRERSGIDFKELANITPQVGHGDNHNIKIAAYGERIDGIDRTQAHPGSHFERDTVCPCLKTALKPAHHTPRRRV